MPNSSNHINDENWPHDLAFLLYDCSRLLRRRIDERMASLELREAQWRVVGLLSRSEGLTQTELATLLGMQKAPLGEQLDRLEASDWIERRRDQHDRRANRLYIGPACLNNAEAINQRFAQLVEEIQKDIPPDDWLDLQNLLDELAASFAAATTQRTLGRLHFVSNLHLIGLISRQLRKQFDGELKKLGTSRSQWLVLSAVMYNPGISQRDLGKRLDMAKAPLGQVLSQLVKRHWLARHCDPTDKRRNQLTVIDDAKPTLNLVAKQYRQLHCDFGEQLGEPTVARLEQRLQQLRTTLLTLSQQRGSFLPQC